LKQKAHIQKLKQKMASSNPQGSVSTGEPITWNNRSVITINKAEISRVEAAFVRNLHYYIQLRQQAILKKSIAKKEIVRDAIQQKQPKDKHLAQILRLVRQNLNPETSQGFSFYKSGISQEEETSETPLGGSGSGMNQQMQSTPRLHTTIWLSIKDHLDELKDNDDLTGYVVNYTNILRVHIDNRVPLEHSCIIGLVSCVRPSYIEAIFDRALIDETSRIQCLFKPRMLFNSFTHFMHSSDSELPFYLIMSMSVLVFKCKCLPFKARVRELFNELAIFVNRQRYDQRFRRIGVKCFVQACLLNGLLSVATFNSFLTSTRKNSSGYYVEMSDYDSSDDDDDDDDDVDMSILSYSSDDSVHSNVADNNNNHRRFPRPNQRIRNVPNQYHPNHPPLRAPAPLPLVKVTDNIKNLSDLSHHFPDTLKNLVRIKIKNLLREYHPSNVERLPFLPVCLKRFISFQDEIDLIKKLTKDTEDFEV
jgi:hypothetical protein